MGWRREQSLQVLLLSTLTVQHQDHIHHTTGRLGNLQDEVSIVRGKSTLPLGQLYIACRLVDLRRT